LLAATEQYFPDYSLNSTGEMSSDLLSYPSDTAEMSSLEKREMNKSTIKETTSENMACL
jgi:hypothetical protein